MIASAIAIEASITFAKASVRNRPLNEPEKLGNRPRSKVRARVEHVFGAQANDMGGTLVRYIGIARANAQIGLKNLAYNNAPGGPPGWNRRRARPDLTAVNRRRASDGD